ncbi:MAG: tetratricopeptide repeat protein, partial [Dehalococcoidia bacterium]
AGGAGVVAQGAAGPIAEAEALVERGQLDEAIATLQRALSEAETPDLHVAVCTLYLRRGDAAGARRALERAISLDPGCAVAHAYIAGMDLHAGRVADAQDRLDYARDLAPDDLIVRIKRAEYWLRLGIFDNARAELRHALQNGGGSPQNRAIAEAMFASIEKRSRGSFTRKTVALPSLGAAKKLFRHGPARDAARAEAEA